MPKPHKGETRSHFLNRCIPQVIADGAVETQDQAIGRCNGIYTNAQKEMTMSNSRKKRKEQALADDPQMDKEMEQLTDKEAEAVTKTFVEDIPNMYPPQITKEQAYDDAMKGAGEKMAESISPVIELPFGGAQSWEELKEYEDAENVSEGVRQAKYEFSVMVNNVLNDPDLEVTAKGEKIKALAEGFSSRADENVEKDIQPDLFTKILSAVGLDNAAKARMTAAAINDLPDSKFAYIEPGGKKDDQGKTVPRSLRHYPIHDAPHVRNALARAAQQIKKGGKAGDIARRAMPKIRAAAKKLGIGKSSDFTVFKDKNGNDRWLGRVSNKWRDREHEIISETAHKEFVEWVYADKENRMPQLWLWHTPWTAAKNRADFLDYADGFLIASGILTKDEAAMYNKLADKYDLAMSHGFFKDEKSYDPKNKVINKYRSFEGSALPIDYVANEWTDFTTLQEVKEMAGFTEERRKYLVDAIGEERVAQEEGKNKDIAEVLKELKVDFKADEEETQPIEVEETEEELVEVIEVPDEVAEEIGKGLNVSALNQFLEAQNAKMEGQDAEIKGLKENVETLTKAIITLVKSDDEKIAQQITPRAHLNKEAKPIWEQAASKSDSTIIKEGDEDEKLLASKPTNPQTPTTKEEDKTAAGWVRGAIGAPVDIGASVPRN